MALDFSITDLARLDAALGAYNASHLPECKCGVCEMLRVVNEKWCQHHAADRYAALDKVSAEQEIKGFSVKE